MRKISLHRLSRTLLNSTQQSIDSETLYDFKEIFDEETLRALHSFKVQHEDTAVPQQEEKQRKGWTCNDLQANCPLDAGDLEVILATINELCGANFDHISLALWEDSEGYKIDKHVDNKSFTAAMQIFLPTYLQDMKLQDSEPLRNTGTQFYKNNSEDIIQVPFIPNTGYFVTNSQKVFHSSGEPVPHGLIRSSAYFIFR
tara:strand:- start:443 stop:1042 length:600 start_codon:yes stop_codon:yes gene_type:complete